MLPCCREGFTGVSFMLSPMLYSVPACCLLCRICTSYVVNLWCITCLFGYLVRERAQSVPYRLWLRWHCFQFLCTLDVRLLDEETVFIIETDCSL
jgi:hypothetical protein